MMLRWFVSSKYRQGFAARKQHALLLAARRDAMPPEGVAAMLAALAELDGALADGHSGRILIKVEELQFAAAQWLPPYPRHIWRGTVEIIVVALVLALGIRTFFVQPFKIPTGSMQPTLYGVNYLNLLNQKELTVPTGWSRALAWIQGVAYVRVVAQASGAVDRVGPVRRILSLNIKQSFWLGGVEHEVWFPPDLGDAQQGIAPLIWHPGRLVRTTYRKGEEVINFRRRSGDYLLADRLTYNFRRPARGEIIVFKTSGISDEAREHFNITPDEFYIKRLVGLPGERIQIGDDRHLIVNGNRLDATTPHFRMVYGYDPGPDPLFQPYLGHLNGSVARKYHLNPGFAPLFPDAQTTYTNPPDSCLVMGDNTVDSLDSRYWGAFSEDAVLGKCWFVFWPVTARFGWWHD